MPGGVNLEIICESGMVARKLNANGRTLFANARRLTRWNHGVSNPDYLGLRRRVRFNDQH
jgi:hypothetical protein